MADSRPNEPSFIRQPPFLQINQLHQGMAGQRKRVGTHRAKVGQVLLGHEGISRSSRTYYSHSVRFLLEGFKDKNKKMYQPDSIRKTEVATLDSISGPSYLMSCLHKYYIFQRKV